ncbi:MAG: UvrD-helicase domain-containing protein [Leptospiraceae bacterium]|nr:UvrD-helicase domain-containing protein [Leptospiraceae bacterium]
MNTPKLLYENLRNGFCVFLEASAGTGKTTTIIETVALLLQDQDFTDQFRKKILLLTFTEKATAEMQEKLMEKENLASQWLRQVEVRTIDGFFAHLSRQFFLELGHDPRAQYIDESRLGAYIFEKLIHRDWLLDETSHKALKELCLCEKAIFGSIDSLVYAFLKFDKIVTDSGESWEKFQDAIIPRKTSSAFLTLYQSWKKSLEQSRKELAIKSYSSLMFDILAMSSQKQKLIDIMRERYAAVFVDEFQDTNQAQWKIFENLFVRNGVPFCTVGDPKQSIYAFRGADLSNYLKIRTQIARGERHQHNFVFLKLTQNYRSSSKLIEALNFFFGARGANSFFLLGESLPYIEVEASATLEQKYHAFFQNETPFTLIYLPQGQKKGDNLEYMAHYCAEKIQYLFQRYGTYGITYSDFAILIEKRDFYNRLSPILDHYKIPHFFYKRRGLLLSEAARHFLILLESLSSGEKQKERLSFVTAFLGSNIHDVLNAQNLGPKEEYYTKLLHMAQRRNWTEFFRLLRQGSLWSFLKLYHRDQYDAYIDTYRQILELAESYALQSDCNLLELAHYFYEIATRGESENELNLFRQRDSNSLTIITMHQSKGLEFPFVFCLFDLNKMRRYSTYFPEKIEGPQDAGKDPEIKIFLTDLAIEDDTSQARNEIRDLLRLKQDQEDRRLIYVALTRAKYGLWCFTANPIRGADGNLSAKYHTLQVYTDKAELDVFCKNNFIKCEDFSPSTKDFSDRQARLSTHKKPSLALPVEDIAQKQEFLELRRKIYEKTFELLSFSSLKKKQQAQTLMVDFRESGEEVHILEQTQESLLPPGKVTGILLHEFLENISFSWFRGKKLEDLYREIASSQKHPITILLAELLNKHPVAMATWQKAGVSLSYNKACELYQKEILKIIYHSLHAKLGDLGISLVDIDDKDTLRECRFLFLNQDDKELARLSYLTGAIDLIFRHDGLVYFVDYKSNLLDLEHLAYADKTLYGLQQEIYEKAMRRFLASQLKFGGFFYIYLRLTQAKTSQGVISRLYDRTY